LAREGRFGTWRGHGRLYGHGLRLAQYSRIEIEVAAWSNTACELILRPRCRHVRRWGERRWSRYFGLAVAAADALAGAIAVPAVVELAAPATPVPSSSRAA
jgi:hypothetical protein